MCLESTGLHEITFNFIKKIYIAIPLEAFGDISCHLNLYQANCEIDKKLSGCEKLATFLKSIF